MIPFLWYDLQVHNASTKCHSYYILSMHIINLPCINDQCLNLAWLASIMLPLIQTITWNIYPFSWHNFFIKTTFIQWILHNNNSKFTLPIKHFLYIARGSYITFHYYSASIHFLILRWTIYPYYLLHYAMISSCLSLTFICTHTQLNIIYSLTHLPLPP